MKKISNLLGICAMAMATCLSSCDISEDDRFVELPPINIERNVLLLDFTGQRCVNCPEAHEIMAGLKEQYGDKLVCVSVHGGKLALPIRFTDYNKNQVGLMIEEGRQLNDAFGINAWPMGVVDRINANGVALLDTEWARAVREAIQQPTDIKLGTTVALQGDDIDINVSVLSSADHHAALQIWIVEDGIVAQQTTPNGIVKDYVHNDVLRYMQYPLDGQALDLKANMEQTVDVTVPCKWTDKERWNKANLKVVAFVFEDTQILNVTEVKVTDPAQPGPDNNQ